MSNLYRTDVYQPPWLLRIPRAHRNAAAGVWARCGSYAAHAETDGFIEDEIIDGFATPTEIERLVADAAVLARDDERGGWQMLEWAPNPTHQQLVGLRAKDAARARAERQAKAATVHTDVPTDVRPDAPLKTRPNVQTDVRAATSTKSSSSSIDERARTEHSPTWANDGPGKAATDEERAARVAADAAARRAHADATAAARQQAKDVAAAAV